MDETPRWEASSVREILPNSVRRKNILPDDDGKRRPG